MQLVIVIIVIIYLEFIILIIMFFPLDWKRSQIRAVIDNDDDDAENNAW